MATLMIHDHPPADAAGSVDAGATYHRRHLLEPALRHIFASCLAVGLACLLAPQPAWAQSHCPAAMAPLGNRAGAALLVYGGTTPQVYRICKGGSAAADDCAVDVVASGKRVVTLERQGATGCTCVDVEGAPVELRVVAGGGSCAGTAQTLWFDSLRPR